MPRSTNSTAPEKASIRWCPTATATVVLPTPPAPTMVTKREVFSWADSSGCPRPVRPSGSSARQIGMRKAGGDATGAVPRTAGPRDGRDEAIAPPRQRRDVSCAILPVAERLAQSGHVKAQAAFLDDHIRPDRGQQFLLLTTWLGEDVRTIRISRAREPSSTGAPFIVRSRSPAARWKGEMTMCPWSEIAVSCHGLLLREPPHTRSPHSKTKAGLAP